jgi:hypothetical protein
LQSGYRHFFYEAGLSSSHCKSTLWVCGCCLAGWPVISHLLYWYRQQHSFAEWLQVLLLEFDDVVNPLKSLSPLPDSDVFHHIKKSGPPISSKFRHLDGEKLEAARKESEQLDLGRIVRPSDSPWSPPLHMVWKADGSAA